MNYMQKERKNGNKGWCCKVNFFVSLLMSLNQCVMLYCCLIFHLLVKWQPGEMSLEEIEGRLGSLIKAETISQLKSGVWKERLEGFYPRFCLLFSSLFQRNLLIKSLILFISSCTLNCLSHLHMQVVKHRICMNRILVSLFDCSYAFHLFFFARIEESLHFKK